MTPKYCSLDLSMKIFLKFINENIVSVLFKIHSNSSKGNRQNDLILVFHVKS